MNEQTAGLSSDSIPVCRTNWWTEARGETGPITLYHECFGNPGHDGACACPCGAVKVAP